MPKLRLLLCCLALLFLAAPAMAEEDELAPGFDRCMEQSGGVTTEMLGCLQQAYEYWDARLNTNYKKARQACNEKEGRLLPPKSGLFVIAAQAGVDVVPVRIRYDTQKLQ